jgi:hypothetical protein
MRRQKTQQNPPSKKLKMKKFKVICCVVPFDQELKEVTLVSARIVLGPDV